MSKKAQKTPREPTEVEETDEELDKVVTKGKQGRKLSKKEHMCNTRDLNDEDLEDEEGSYKNSM